MGLDKWILGVLALELTFVIFEFEHLKLSMQRDRQANIKTRYFTPHLESRKTSVLRSKPRRWYIVHDEGSRTRKSKAFEGDGELKIAPKVVFKLFRKELEALNINDFEESSEAKVEIKQE